MRAAHSMSAGWSQNESGERVKERKEGKRHRKRSRKWETKKIHKDTIERNLIT